MSRPHRSQGRRASCVPTDAAGLLAQRHAQGLDAVPAELLPWVLAVLTDLDEGLSRIPPHPAVDVGLRVHG